MWDDDEPRRKWGPIIATVLGLGLLVGVIIFALFFLGGKDDGEAGTKIEVPNVVGQTYAEASAAARGAGLQGDGASTR